MNYQSIVLWSALSLAGCVPEIRVIPSDVPHDTAPSRDVEGDLGDGADAVVKSDVVIDVQRDADRQDVRSISDEGRLEDAGHTPESDASFDVTEVVDIFVADATSASDVDDVPPGDVPNDRVCGTCATQRSCPVGTERGCGLVSVTGGSLQLGSAETSTAEPLAGTVAVAGLMVDSHEVTVGRFRRFWLAGHPVPATPIRYPSGADITIGPIAEPVGSNAGLVCNWSVGPASRESHPINCIDWSTAIAFCAWDGGRLPTEAEYEYLVRYRAIDGSPSPRRYPWGGEDPIEAFGTYPRSTPCERAQFQECGGEDGARTRRVGTFPGSGGVFDLAGNVSEWAADSPSMYGTAPCWGPVPVNLTNPLCVPTGASRSLRGGNFHTGGANSLLGAARDSQAGSSRDDTIGFRCVRSP